MAVIPPQLRRDDLLFIIIPRGEKGITRKGWNLVRNGLEYNDKTLIRHVSEGGNYGYYPKSVSNLINLDVDDADVFHACGGKGLVLRTFAYSAWKDKHKYRAVVECPDMPGWAKGSRISIKDGAKNTILELFFPADEEKTKGQCIGPGSLHPLGLEYAIIEDYPIKTISWSDLLLVVSAISPNKSILPPGIKIEERKMSPGGITISERYGLYVTDHLPDSPVYTGAELRGAHPVHGSTTGQNVAMNPTSGVVFCFRCDKGYDAAGWDAVCRGIIECGGDYDEPAMREHITQLEAENPEVVRATRDAYYARVREKIKATKEKKKNALQQAPEVEEVCEDLQEPETEDDKPIIRINNIELSDMVSSAVHTLSKRNAKRPLLFVRFGELVRILRDETQRPSVGGVGEFALRLYLAKAASYRRVTAKGGDIIVSPPRECVQSVLSLGSWEGIPPLQGLIQTPIVHYDGRVVCRPGYDVGTGYYYDPGKALDVSGVPAIPGAKDVEWARSMILEPFAEFPYVTSASKTNVIACLLSVMARNLITCPIPLLIIDKPQMGTGASRICEAIAAIATGQPVNTMPQPENDAEWRKALFSRLSASPPLVIIDNCEGKLSSPILSKMLTEHEITDRVLKESRTATYRNETVWVANGNNIQIGKDLPRRSYWCRLDAMRANPWEREGFKHPDLITWIHETRGILVTAALTLIKGWALSGCKPWARSEGQKVLGGYESWCNVIGGILDYAGIDGFLANQQSMYESVDSESPVLEAFLLAWYDMYGETPTTAGELRRDMLNEMSVEGGDSGDDTLVSFLPHYLSAKCRLSDSRFSVVLGDELSRNVRRVFPSGVMLEKVGTKKRAVTWKVRIVAEQIGGIKQGELTDFFGENERGTGSGGKSKKPIKTGLKKLSESEEVRLSEAF